MYAIVEVGAKQYNVKKDDVIDVERLTAPEGKEIVLDKVLLVSKGEEVQIGRPYLKDAKVSCQILGQEKGEKLISYKYRRRKSSDWKKGHRQKLTRLKVKEIHVG